MDFLKNKFAPVESTILKVLVFLLPVQLGYHFWPTWAFVGGIRVDYLSPTIYLTDILLLLIVIPWIVENYKLIKTAWFYGLLSLIVLNIIFSVRLEVGLYKWIKFIEIALFAFYIAKNRSVNLQKHILTPISYSVVFVCLIGVLQFLLQHDVGGILYFSGERKFTPQTPGIALAEFNGDLILRAYSIFSHPNSFAGYVMVATSFVALAGKKSFLKTSAIASALIGLFVAFSKTVWILIVFLLGFMLVRKEVLVRVIKITFWFAVVVSVLTLPAIDMLDDLSGSKTYIERVELIEVSKEMVVRYPILGVGLGGFVAALPEFSSLSQIVWKFQPVHNIFLLIMAETGAVGFLLFIYILARIIGKVAINNGKVLIPLVLIVLSGMTDHYWLTLQQNQLLFALVLGLSYTKKRW